VVYGFLKRKARCDEHLAFLFAKKNAVRLATAGAADRADRERRFDLSFFPQKKDRGTKKKKSGIPNKNGNTILKKDRF